ncbi:hypothetical protein E8F20_27510 [Pseudomonas sp. BN415]|nr:hypothetical protein [Pseudomonas sp. BN415]
MPRRIVLWQKAQVLAGPTLQLWQALARELEIVIVGGFCERLDAQRVANSAALVDATGVRAIYRKAHLWDAENAIFIAVCDRHGAERGVNWVQGSVIVDPDGYPLAGPAEEGGEQILMATLKLDDARNKRISPHNHLHDDRRPELYGVGGLLE